MNEMLPNKPMKGYTLKDEDFGKIQFPVYSSIKYDGVRVISSNR